MTKQQQQPIDVFWRPPYETLLKGLNKALGSQAGRNRKTIIARCILEMVHRGNNPTAAQIVCSVYDSDAPKGGWRAFDMIAWLDEVPRVVAVLKSSNPASLLPRNFR